MVAWVCARPPSRCASQLTPPAHGLPSKQSVASRWATKLHGVAELCPLRPGRPSARLAASQPLPSPPPTGQVPGPLPPQPFTDTVGVKWGGWGERGPAGQASAWLQCQPAGGCCRGGAGGVVHGAPVVGLEPSHAPSPRIRGRGMQWWRRIGGLTRAGGCRACLGALQCPSLPGCQQSTQCGIMD